MYDVWAEEPLAIAGNETDGHAGDSIARATAPEQSCPRPQPLEASGPEWKFQESPKGDDFDDPTEGEFFTGDGLARALVRESIQNALDAAIDDSKPVCVRFRLGETPADAVPDWLKTGLVPHVAEIEGAGAKFDESCKWLLVEDFNCVGLSGDPEDDYPEDPGSGSGKNHYFYFWRNVGRTDKSSDERGSWGIGKAVFQSASKVRSFFGLTVRHEDGMALLRGKSVLKVHHVSGVRYRPRGNFGKFSFAEGEQQFALPVDDEGLVSEFCEIFDAARVGRSGLSVLVPWLDEEVDDWTVDTLGRYVCEQYFLPIVAGQLVVEVSDGTRKLSIEREDVTGVVDSELGDLLPIDRLIMRETIEFARWAVGLPRDEYLVVDPPTGSTKWANVEFDDDLVSDARDRLDAGERVAFRCGCPVQMRGEEPQMVWFSLYLERDSRLTRPLVTYVRRGITIPNVRSEARGAIRALVVVNWPLLGRLLGDAENPAHTDWEPRKSRVGVRWAQPEGPIRFVRLSAREILLRLEAPDDEIDEELFVDTFSYLQPKQETEPKSDEPGASAPPEPPTSPAVKPLVVDSRRDGFVVKGQAGLEVGEVVVIRVAYATRKGNPLSKWSPLDFELTESEVNVFGAEEIEVSGNSVTAKVTNPGAFKVEVSGFDPHRDLAIDVAANEEDR